VIRYTQEHFWVRLEEGAGAIAGITRHAQDTLGEIVLVDVQAQGRQSENAVVGVVESVKTASDLHMPLDAEIAEVNPALQDTPGLVNDDPMGAGWILRLANIDGARFATLLDEAAYLALTNG
jgi:glycine cleavage system H protein